MGSRPTLDAISLIDIEIGAIFIDFIIIQGSEFVQCELRSNQNLGASTFKVDSDTVCLLATFLE